MIFYKHLFCYWTFPELSSNIFDYKNLKSIFKKVILADLVEIRAYLKRFSENILSNHSNGSVDHFIGQES